VRAICGASVPYAAHPASRHVSLHLSRRSGLRKTATYAEPGCRAAGQHVPGTRYNGLAAGVVPALPSRTHE